MSEEFQKLLQISSVNKVVSARCLSTGEIVSLRHVTGGDGIVLADNWYYEDTLLPPGAVRIMGGEPVLDDSNILTPMKKKQMVENAEKSVKRQKILFYAGIAIVIGIVAFIIIKKRKK